MAYPTVSAPYGFRPVNLLGGRVFAGSTRQMAIQNAHGTNIFYGDVVILSSNGCITGAVLTATAVNVAGVFLGCSFINSSGQRVYSQYFPSGTTGTVDTSTGITAYVADDPQVLMKVAIVSSGTTISGRTRDVVGENVAIVYNTGSTVTGDGAAGVSSVGATTTTLPLRVVDVVPETVNSSGSFTEVIVMWNPTINMYTSSSGV
jgi:hypothetical protein